MVQTLTIKTFDALSSNTRIKILKLLRKKRMNLSEISRNLNMSKSSVSEHIEKLLEAELIAKNQHGKWVYYSLTDLGRKIVEGVELVVKVTLSIGIALIATGLFKTYEYLTRPKFKVITDVMPVSSSVYENIVSTISDLLPIFAIIIGIVLIVLGLKLGQYKLK